MADPATSERFTVRRQRRRRRLLPPVASYEMVRRKRRRQLLPAVLPMLAMLCWRRGATAFAPFVTPLRVVPLPSSGHLPSSHRSASPHVKDLLGQHRRTRRLRYIAAKKGSKDFDDDEGGTDPGHATVSVSTSAASLSVTWTTTSPASPPDAAGAIASAAPSRPKSGRVRYGWTAQNAAIALPALLGLLVDPLLSLMDTFYTGQLGRREDLAALGACTSIFHLAFNGFRATTAATTSLVAGALAAGATPQDSSSPTDPTPAAEARAVATLSLQFGSVLGLGVLAGLALGGNAFLRHMGIPSSSPLHPPAAAYLFTRCWAAPVVLWMGVAEGVFRGHGDTTVPLLASLAAALLNLVLDPLLMFRCGMGVRGAAAATAMAQMGAAAVYAYWLRRRGLLPSPSDMPRAWRWRQWGRQRRQQQQQAQDQLVTVMQDRTSRSRTIIRAILGANASMILKQGSLLFGWAFATARATRLGAAQVAAHQIALSVWLVFALLLDGTAVSAQVLMSRAHGRRDGPRVASLTRYMLGLALLQGLLSLLVVDGIDLLVPRLFTADPAIQAPLHRVMPHLAWQQVLVSLTLVMEALATGANEFAMLAVGTAAATVAALGQLARQTTVDGIWCYGIGTLFVSRFATAAVALARALWKVRGAPGDAAARDGGKDGGRMSSVSSTALNVPDLD